jgi:hypothetical protein
VNDELPLPFPLGGLSETVAKDKQPPDTTPSAVNVMPDDSLGDRIRGGTRDCIALVAGTAPSSLPIRQIGLVQYDNRGSTYANATSAMEEWAKETPLKQMARAVEMDGDRNRYAIDGLAGVAKWNAAGELVWKFVTAVESQEHIIRALCVADDGSVYVGVSAGYPQSSAKVMKYRPASDGVSPPSLEWTIGGAEPRPGLELAGYVERIRLRDGVLWMACNFPDTGKSEIRLYRAIDTGVPELAFKRTQVRYPINDMDLRAVDGAVLTAHEANATAYYDPRSPDTQKIIEDWTPDRLTSADLRDWTELDASDLDGDDTFNSLWSNGELLDIWYDGTQNNRNAYSYESAGVTAPANCTPPILNKSKKFAGRDTVSFSAAGSTLAGAHNGMISAPNGGIAAATADIQRTLIPTYTGAKGVIVAVVRSADVTATVRALLGQLNSAGTETRAILINANTTGGSDFTAAAGVAALYTPTNKGPYAAYNTSNGFALLCFTYHNDGTALTAGLNSVNGTDCTNDTYTGRAITSTIATQLGRSATTISGTTSSFGPFVGELAYLRVWRDYSAGTIISTAEFQKLEGWAHWRFGVPLPAGHLYEFAPPTDDPLPGGTDSAYLALSSPKQMLVKWDPNKARPRAVLKDSTTVGIGGIGYACAWPKNGATDFCFSVGPKGDETGASTDTLKRTARSVVRRIKDGGDSLTHTGTGTWESLWGTFTSGTPSAALEPSYHYPKICVSGIAANSPQDGTAASDLYVPYHVAASYPSIGLYLYITSGTAAGTATNTPPALVITLASGSRGYAAAVERDIPEYEPGLLSSKYDQYVFIGTELQGASTNAVSNVLLVNETRANANPRSTYVLVATGTTLRRVSGSSLAAPSSNPTLAGGNYTWIQPHAGKLIVADGVGYWEVEPRVSDGVVKALKSKSAGTYPKNCRILASWFDTLVFVRGELPTIVFQTKIGNFHDCDTRPIDPSGAEAVAYPVDGAVNAFIPATQDTAIIGTQTGMYRVDGHIAQGGVVKRIGDVQGIAFGEAWCKDPEGGIYYFGSRGGVELLGHGSLTEGHVDTTFKGFDLSTYWMRLAWSWRYNGLLVVPCPQGTGSGTPFMYFWHRPTRSWWRWEMPWWVTSVRQVDGDTIAAREVWLGCEDGKVRKFSPSATTDDGSVALTWNFYVGPYRSKSAREQIMLSRPKLALGTGSSSVLVGLYPSADSERPASAHSSYTLTGPLTVTAPVTARGANVWVRLSGSGRMAYESGTIKVDAMGLRKALS